MQDAKRKSTILTESTVAKLVELLTSQREDEEVCGDLLDVLVFCAEGDKKTLLQNKDVAVPTNEIIKKYYHSQSLVEKCLSLLSMLSSLGDLNIQQILSSMTDYPSSSNVQRDALATLGCFLRANTKNAAVLLNLKGIPLCVRAVDRFFDDLAIQVNGLQVLSLLSQSDDCLSALVASTAPEVSIRSIKRFGKEESVVMSTMQLLSRCATVSSEFITNSSSLDYIIEVVLDWKEKDVILLNGCRLITLCAGDSRLGHGMIDSGVLEILTRILTKEKQDAKLVESSLVAIMTLTSIPAGRESMSKAALLDVFLPFYEKQTEVKRVELCTGILADVTAVNESHALVMKQTYKVVVQNLRKYVAEKSVSSPCLRVLKNLSDDASTCQSLMGTDALSLCIESIQKFMEDAVVVELATGFIENMLNAESANLDVFRDKSGVSTELNALAKHPAHLAISLHVLNALCAVTRANDFMRIVKVNRCSQNIYDVLKHQFNQSEVFAACTVLLEQLEAAV